MIRRILAGVLVFIFVLLSLVFSIFFALKITLLNSNFYNADYLGDLRSFLIQEIPKIASANGFRLIPESDVQNILSNNLSVQDLENVINEFEIQLKSMRAGESGNVSIKIPLDWLNEKSAIIGADISNHLFVSLPKCDDSVELIPIENNQLKCVPKNMVQLDFQSKMGQILDGEYFANLPDVFTLNFNLPQIGNENVADFFSKIIYEIFLVFALIFLLLSLLIWLLIFKPAMRVLKWESYAVFLASLSASVLMLVLLTIPFFIGKFYVPSLGNLFPPDFYVGLYNLSVSVLAKNLLYYSVPVLILSLAIWFISISYDKSERTA